MRMKIVNYVMLIIKTSSFNIATHLNTKKNNRKIWYKQRPDSHCLNKKLEIKWD